MNRYPLMYEIVETKSWDMRDFFVLWFEGAFFFFGLIE